jgi:glycosyltransferase involved in cell wall biosynthesis
VGKLRVVEPTVDLERFDPQPAVPDGPLRVVYIGTLGLAHGLDTLIEAALLAGRSRVLVRLVGDGAERARLARRITMERIANVQLLGPVAPGEVAGLYASADVGTVLLRNRRIFDEALPTKLLEVLGAGRAALVAAPGAGGPLVVGAGAGLAVGPDDPVRLAAAIRALHADRDRVRTMGLAARRLAEDRFGRDCGVDRWIAVVAQAIERRSGARC